MKKAITNEDLIYKKLSDEEKQSKGILGQLYGICADCMHPTRNGRKYAEKLWDKVFSDPIMQEKIAARVVFGELGHPEDRTDIDMEKIAVCLTEVPKKDKDGKLWAKFDILDTPNGRILKTLCDYGCKVGVSSRGQGDLITDAYGNEEVDPSTYECECFDIVCLPAVKEARLNLVTESLNKKKSLKESLDKLLNEASDKDKKIMEETINSLNEQLDHYSEKAGELRGSLYSLINKFIEENPEVNEKDIVIEFRTACANLFGDQKEDQPIEKPSVEEVHEECNNENCADKEVVNESEKSVDNSEDALVAQLQEALKQKQNLERMVIELQEKLSVSYAKELNLKEEVDKSKKSISKLSSDSKKVVALQEKVSKLVDENSALTTKLDDSAINVSQLNESIKAEAESKASLTEQLNAKDKQIKSLSESYDEAKAEFEHEKEALNESIAELQKDLKQKTSEYSSKLDKSNQLVEKYHRIANKAVDKYIDSQALKLGVTSNEIKNKLSESYTFNDIDAVCEDLRGYQLTLSKLPFQSNLTENMKIKATTKKQTSSCAEDVVDDSLLRLAGMK